MKQKYLARLTCWARWMLPPKEAKDVIADYQDIVDDPELFQDLERPRKAVRSLAQTKPYRIWLAVFIALSACILILGVSPLPGMWRFWTHCFYLRYFDIHLGAVLAFLGMAGALVWFRWKGYQEARLPRAIPVLLVLLLAWTGAVLLVNWLWMRDPLSFAGMWGETPVYALFGLVRIGPPDYTVSRSFHMLQTALEYGGFAMALIGEFGLVKARLEDRRWIAVYVLGMAAMLVCMSTLALMTSMELPDLSAAAWWVPYLQTWLVYAGIGAVGAGAALC